MPHERDEFYLVISGKGKFKLSEQVTSFKPGDFLYVPAYATHRFVEFTDDFVTWVFFTANDLRTAKEQDGGQQKV